MEGSIHQSLWPLWIHCNVLQFLQCATHIPGIYKPHLYPHDWGTLAQDLHGQSWHSHPGDLALHYDCTHHDLPCLCKHDLFLKLLKCLFDALKMEFLGMIIDQGQVAMDPVKLTAIQDWRPPASIKGICSFLEFANFYCKFIPNSPMSSLPLISSPKNTNPGLRCPSSKRLLISFALPSPQVQFSLSLTLLVLSLLWLIFLFLWLVWYSSRITPIATPTPVHTYFSKTSIPAEQNYDIYGWKLLAICNPCTQRVETVQGTCHPVLIITNHIKDPHKLFHCQACWFSFCRTLTSFGKSSLVSRWPLPIPYLTVTPSTYHPTMSTPLLSLSQLLPIL